MTKQVSVKPRRIGSSVARFLPLSVAVAVLYVVPASAQLSGLGSLFNFNVPGQSGGNGGLQQMRAPVSPAAEGGESRIQETTGATAAAGRVGPASGKGSMTTASVLPDFAAMNARIGVGIREATSGDDSTTRVGFGGAEIKSGLRYSTAGAAVADILDSDTSLSYSNTLTKTFNTKGFTQLAACMLSDSAACSALSFSVANGVNFDMHRNLEEERIAQQVKFLPQGGVTLQAMNHCMVTKQQSGYSLQKAYEACLSDEVFSLTEHPQNQSTTGTGTGSGSGGGIFLSTLLFEAEAKGAEKTELPGGNTSSTNESLQETMMKGAKEFKRLFGDVQFIADTSNPGVAAQVLKIQSPWEASSANPDEFVQALGENKDQELRDKCMAPVSLEFARFCWAYHLYTTIQWTIASQCQYFNYNAEVGTNYDPMQPRGGQGNGNSTLVGSGSSAAAKRPGPWGVNIDDWQRVAGELSFPGYQFNETTAEAFFFGYRKEFMRAGGNVFQQAAQIFSNPWGDLRIPCDEVNKQGYANFSYVAQNWNKKVFPAWIRTAMGYANARALLHTRGLVMTAWTIIQQFTSNLGYKDLAEAARQLLVASYDMEREAMVVKELESIADILEELELEYQFARTGRGATTTGNIGRSGGSSGGGMNR